jgi:hypothetical protein
MTNPLNRNVDLGTYVSGLNEKITALENVVSEMSLERRRRSTRKMQSVNLTGMTRALCVATIDPLVENRVQFYHPLLHEPDVAVAALPFAKPVSAAGGFDDCGMMWVPPAGSTLVVFFENGNRYQPYYVGTTWQRDRGSFGSKLGYPVDEYIKTSRGFRDGYLVGANDESQCLPSWNTESSNCKDFDSVREFEHDTEAQAQATYPNIYGFKTPEKHMLKMVDGNVKCNRRGKRMELLSGGGNWMIFKDDHLHHGGQFSHPDCNPNPGGEDITACFKPGANAYYTQLNGTPIEGLADCEGKTSPSNILGGHPSVGNPKSKYYNKQQGTNKFFKHENECRPYKGPGTPQNNRCDLPQSGIQFLSIGGHTLVMDDSVEEPKGRPTWHRSTDTFDFGCNDLFQGRFYLMSATGHGMYFSDVESKAKLRGEDNFIKIESAAGNSLEFNDHTVHGEGGQDCPPNYAGEKRGIRMTSTSNHRLVFNDNGNQQCGPTRARGGSPTNKATDAYISLQSGAGTELRFSDDHSQQQTMSQWAQLLLPQDLGEGDEQANRERGPHFLRFQARPKGQPGVIFLRAGGHSVRQTHDMDVVLVGDREKNPSDKFTYVSRKNISAAENVDYRYSGERHILFAEKEILLMAGRDSPAAPGKKCCGPALYPIVLGRCPIKCPLTGIIHFSVQSLSERVFASGYNPSVCGGGSGQCPPGGEPMPCQEDPETSEIDTGNGTIPVNTTQTQGQKQ